MNLRSVKDDEEVGYLEKIIVLLFTLPLPEIVELFLSLVMGLMPNGRVRYL